MKTVRTSNPESSAVYPGTHERGRLDQVSLYCGFVACAVLLATLHGKHLLDSDEGLILHGASSILSGKVLYTDFFEFVAPGSFYLVAGAWWLFGAHYWVAKFIGIAAIGSAAVGVYRVGDLALGDRRHSSPAWVKVLGPMLLCLFSGYWPVINHNTFSLPLIVWSTYFLCRSIVRSSLNDAIIAGLTCGAAIVFLQHRGAALAVTGVAMLGCIYLRKRSPASRNRAAAFGLAMLAFPAMLLLFWPASLLVDNLVRFPALHYLESNRVDLSLFFFVGTLIVAAAWLLRFHSGRVPWLLFFMQIVFLAGALQRPDPSHVTPLLFPLLALIPLLMQEGSVSPGTRFFRIWIAAGLLVLNFQVPIIAANRYSTPLFEASQHPAIRYVKEKCTASRYLYAGPFVPGYYYETGKLNATRFSFLLTKLTTDEQFAQALGELQRHSPQCAITNYGIVEKFGYDNKNVIDSYVAQHYQVVFQAGRIQVWMAKAAGP